MNRCDLRVTVVVPVYNRAEELRRLLAGLVEQSMKPADYEILICDDGSDEDIVAIVEDLQSKWGPDIECLRQPNQGPGAARNLGLSKARSPIVAFTDSDCLVDHDWLLRLIDPIEQGRADMCGGLIGFRTADYLSGRCVNFLMSSMLGAGGARDPRSIVHMEYFPRAGNAAVRRSLALAAGGFPEHNHGEDIEFSHRMMEQGARIEFVPDAIVVHNEKRSLRQVAKEAFLKGVARVRLSRDLGVHQWVHALPATMVVALVAGLLAAIVFPQFALLMAMPAILYCGMLVLVGVQGTVVLCDVRAGIVLPAYAALMHFGYGFGYLLAMMQRGQRLPADSGDAVQSEAAIAPETISPPSAGRDRRRPHREGVL